ncbi:MAG: hypothetical protein LBT83_11435 [Tannerella sp.]|jgi:hypothetical protein|nr:hypothetical protein [Tannerella sp.]
MKIEDVPQDNKYLGQTTLRDVYYALDENGEYCQVTSVGWEAKNEALALTWEHISEEAEALRQEVLAGKKSPLAYHMEVRLFDMGLLASYTGIPKKTIKKHLQAGEFALLDDASLQIYAEALSMRVEELKRV